MSDNDLYRRRLIERLEGEQRDATEAIARARADEARAHARYAEAGAAIERVRAASDPKPDECKRCRFVDGRTSVLRPAPSKKPGGPLVCPVCGEQDTRSA